MDLQQGAQWWHGNRRRRRRYNRPRTSPSLEMAPKIAKARSSSACSPAHFCNRASPSPSPQFFFRLATAALEGGEDVNAAQGSRSIVSPRSPSDHPSSSTTFPVTPDLLCPIPHKRVFYLLSEISLRNTTKSPPPPPATKSAVPLFLELVSKLRRQFSHLPGKRKSRSPAPSAASLILYLLSLFFGDTEVLPTIRWWLPLMLPNN
jgi:hypothetical protein